MLQCSESSVFVAEARTARRARRVLARVLYEAEVSGSFRDAELLLSELVTNAVLHTESTVIRVDIDAHADGRLRLVVVDNDPALQLKPGTVPGELGGLGLSIVDQLAHDWGVEFNGDTKAVWAELRL